MEKFKDLLEMLVACDDFETMKIRSNKLLKELKGKELSEKEVKK